MADNRYSSSGNRNTQTSRPVSRANQSRSTNTNSSARPQQKNAQSARVHQSQAKKARKKRNRRIRRVICLLLIVVLIAGGYCYHKFKTYDSYEVLQTISMANGTEVVEISSFSNGYVKITESGITYFNKNGVIWAEAYTMSQPVYDICRGYIAVGDIKQKEVYIYNKDGLVGMVSTQYSIIDLEVSKAGVIACATDDDEANYIEVYDKSGNEILTARSVFSSSGYLADIALSDDGERLAAVFINVDILDIVSRVVFYDFSDTADESETIVGGFSQYTDTVLTNVEFMGSDKVVAVGDNAYTIYDFSGAPEIITEDLELEYTIRSVIFSDKYFAFIIDDTSEAYNYEFLVYNRKGEIVAEEGFDFSYTKAQFYSKGIMLTSENACHVYNFDGTERFSCAFEESIMAMYPAGYARLIYAMAAETSFIKLK